MLSQVNRLHVMEILHRLEVRDSVSVEELIYLHAQAQKHPEVDQWVKKLLVNNEAVNSEMRPSNDFFAA